MGVARCLPEGGVAQTLPQAAGLDSAEVNSWDLTVCTRKGLFAFPGLSVGICNDTCGAAVGIRRCDCGEMSKNRCRQLHELVAFAFFYGMTPADWRGELHAHLSGNLTRKWSVLPGVLG